MDARHLPFYVDLAAVADVPDAVAALKVLERLEVRRVQVGTGQFLGETWGTEHKRWAERLLLHHACLSEQDSPRWNLSSGDEEVRRRAIDEASEAMRISAELGAPFYAVHAGWALQYTRDHNDEIVGDTITLLRARDQLCRSLDRLATLAETRGIPLLVETAPEIPEERSPFADPEAMLAVIARVGAPHLGLLLDLPAIVITARWRGEAPETVVDYLRPRVQAMELHHGDGKQVRHLPLQETDLEFALARHAGGLVMPVILTLRDLQEPALRDQLALAREALLPPRSEAVQLGPEARS